MSGRVCSVCSHPDREAIDSAIIQNDANRRVATRHHLSEAAVRRHKSKCVGGALEKAQDAVQVAQSETLLERVEAALGRVSDLQLEAELLFREAVTTREKVGALGATIGLFKEAREHLALLGKLVGTLMTGDSAAEVLGRQYAMTGSDVRSMLESRLQLRAMTDEQLDKALEEKYHVRIERIES